MRLEPVLDPRSARYPTAEYLASHPELLDVLPERWRRSPYVQRILGGAVCLLLAHQTACSGTRAGSRIAPLFVHGEGRGNFGCDAVNPPTFLTEAEARQVIQEEAATAGLTFAPDALTAGRSLVLDGFDRRHNVAYEFVSDVDTEERTARRLSTAYTVAPRDAAESIRAELNGRGQSPWIGVFYDPASRKGQGAAELRAQVRDFIAWLKAQGVI